MAGVAGGVADGAAGGEAGVAGGVAGGVTGGVAGGVAGGLTDGGAGGLRGGVVPAMVVGLPVPGLLSPGHLPQVIWQYPSGRPGAGLLNKGLLQFPRSFCNAKDSCSD